MFALKKLLIYILIQFASHLVSAQVELWGASVPPGINSGGSIFRFEPATKTFTNVYTFDVLEENNPSELLMDGHYIYGFTNNYGAQQLTKLFKFDIENSTLSYLYQFNKITDGWIPGPIVKAWDNKLYGVVLHGGMNDCGTLYSFDLITKSYTKLIDFDWPIGRTPVDLILESGFKNLYGVPAAGGVHNRGVIFRYSITNNIFYKVHDFNSGTSPTSIYQGSDNIFYGITYFGGLYDSGVLFQYNPSPTTFFTIYEISLTQGAGKGKLIEIENELYGKTDPVFGYPWNQEEDGMIFKFNYQLKSLTNLITFDENVFGKIHGSDLNLASDELLHGTTISGGANNLGCIYSYDYKNNYFDILHYNSINEYGGIELIEHKKENQNGTDFTIIQFDDAFYLVINDLKMLNSRFKMLDITGRELAALNINSTSTRIELESTPGIYIFMLINSSGKINSKKMFIK